MNLSLFAYRNFHCQTHIYSIIANITSPVYRPRTAITGHTAEQAYLSAKISVPLNTKLQAVACRLSTPQPLTLCSVYLPPSSSWTHADLISLTSQLPSPVLLLGDFNAHDSLWGCTTTDNKGQEVTNFLMKTNLCLMNEKVSTYIHPATGSRSSMQLNQR